MFEMRRGLILSERLLFPVVLAVVSFMLLSLSFCLLILIQPRLFVYKAAGANAPSNLESIIQVFSVAGPCSWLDFFFLIQLSDGLFPHYRSLKSTVRASRVFALTSPTVPTTPIWADPIRLLAHQR